MKRHAHQIMTRKPVTTRADVAVEVAARRLLEADVSCLPVVDADDRVVGIVTCHDLLRAVRGLPCAANHRGCISVSTRSRSGWPLIVRASWQARVGQYG